MEFVFFKKRDTPEPVQFGVYNGAIPLAEVCRKFQLKPETIERNGILFAADIRSDWKLLKEAFSKSGQPVGATRDTPAEVAGDTAVPSLATGFAVGPRLIAVMDDGNVMEATEDGLSMDSFVAGPKPTLSRSCCFFFLCLDGANRISLSTRTKCEFDFELMNTWKPGDRLDTAKIAEALKDYGGFPSLYYVRLEETMVFRKCLDLLIERPSTDNRLRVVLLGSPGVGKSVFLVLFAFYLAHVQSRSVLILRKVKGGFPKQIFALVHVCREGYSGATFNELSDFRGIRDQPGHSLMFFDGFTQSDVNSIHNSLGSFSLLATSSQYNLKSDDVDTRCILLPAWLPEDLRAICKIICREHFEEHFEEAYSYSGGSLREFLSTEKERFNVFKNAISRISDPRNLLTIHGAGTKEQFDTIRKLFVKDRTEAEDYDTIAQWVPTVDSRMAVLKLLDRLFEENFGKMLKIGKGVGGVFYGNAFEWYIHKKASSPGGLSFEARGYDDSNSLVVFDVPGKAAVCKGEKLEECLKGVKDWLTLETKYWYPQMSNFPNIDSIAVCNATIDGVAEEYLVYIQITTAVTHDLNHVKLNMLDQTFEAQYADRAYVALLPEDGPKETFLLIGDVKKARIPCYVGTLCSGGRKKKRNSQ